MKVHYVDEIDALYLSLGDQSPDGAIEIAAGVNLDTRLAPPKMATGAPPRRSLPRPAPYRPGFIMDLNEHAGSAVAFYFIPPNTDRKLDNCVSLDDPRRRTLLRAIHARGHEIGIHPGDNTYKHPEAPACSKPRPVRYAMFLDGIGPGGFQNRWSRRGLKY